MNHETESMARVAAQRAVYDYRDYHRSRLSLIPRPHRRIMFLCFSLSLLAFYWLICLSGCNYVTQYDLMQEENDRAHLVRAYRDCVDTHASDPSVCDHITSGLDAASLTFHRANN